jgi:hypothetical protein
MPDEVLIQETAVDTTAHEPEAGVVEQQPAESTDATGGAEDAGNEDDQQNKALTEEERKKSEKRISGWQKRVNELTRDKYAERQAREQLAQQNAALLALVKARESQAASPPKDQGPPRQEQYTDYDAYQRDLAAHYGKLAASQHFEQLTKHQQEQLSQQMAIQRERAAIDLFAQRAAETAKSVPDYAEVMEDAESIQVPNNVLAKIRMLDNGPLVAYHMIKNPALAQQFFTKPPEMHDILLGQLSATVKVPAKVSNAPPPGTPAKGKAVSANDPPEDTDAYMAWAAKHMR